MLKTDSELKERKLMRSPVQWNPVKCSRKSKKSTPCSNPFGGRRMIFTSCASPSDGKHRPVDKSSQNNRHFTGDSPGYTGTPNLVKDESRLSPGQLMMCMSSSRRNNNKRDSDVEDVERAGGDKAKCFCEDDYDTISVDETPVPHPGLDPDSSELVSRCPDVNGSLEQVDRVKNKTERKSAMTGHPKLRKTDLTDQTLQSEGTNFNKTRLSGRGQDSASLNFLQGLLRSRDPPPRSDRYTIVFSEERHQDTGSMTSPTAKGQPNQAPQDHGPHCDTVQGSNSKNRKFLIRREKHAAETGKDEDATFTIHVCSQLFGETSKEIISTAPTKKKETRGDIFRKNASLHQDDQVRFRSTKAFVWPTENPKLASQGRSATLDCHQRRISRLSSLSPPRQNKNDAAFTRQRSKSQHTGETLRRKGSRPRFIRLIDHLEIRERGQTSKSTPTGDCYASKSETCNSAFERNRQSLTRHDENAKENGKSRDAGDELKACRRQKDGDDISQPYLSKQTPRIRPLLHASNTADKCLFSVNKTDIERKEGNASNRDSTPELEMLSGPVGSSRHPRPGQDTQPEPVLKTDAACQYSPPANSCCLCHCHESQPDAQRSSRDKVTAKRQVYHRIRYYYPCRRSVRMRGKGQLERSSVNSTKQPEDKAECCDKLGDVDQDPNDGEDARKMKNRQQSRDGENESETFMHSDIIETSQKTARDMDNKTEGLVFETVFGSSRKEGSILWEYDDEESDDDMRNILSTSGSSTSSQSGCKNNSASQKAAKRNRNVSNSFREIVEQAKRRSSVSVRPLDKNSSFQRNRETPVLGQTGHTEETGHYFIGDYLLSLWKKQVLCDVRVNVNNTHFLAHKLVLAAFSDIFTPTTPYPEPTLQFNVPNASPESVYRVFKYIYTACMDVRDDQLEETLHVGIFLGIKEIKDVILEILSKPTLDNVEMYIDIQNRCGLTTSVMDYPHLYQNYLIHMIYMEKFLQLTSEELEVILRDPNVLVETEVDTLHALAVWAQYNPLDRVSEVPRLLDYIIFEVISPGNIAKIVQLYDPIFSEIGARNKISEVFRFHALQLAHKLDKVDEACFVENVPGISQDPLMDRVSYIPSQGAMAKHQERPSLARPSVRKSHFNEARRSSVNSVRQSLGRKSAKASQHLVDYVNKSFASPHEAGFESLTEHGETTKAFAFGRQSTKSQTGLPDANGNANFSNTKSRRRKNFKTADRSNNSATTGKEEMQASDIIQEGDTFCRTPSGRAICVLSMNEEENNALRDECRVPQPAQVCPSVRQRLRRQDLWAQASYSSSSLKELQLSWHTKNDPLKTIQGDRGRQALGRGSTIGNQATLQRQLWFSESQLDWERQVPGCCAPEPEGSQRNREKFSLMPSFFPESNASGPESEDAGLYSASPGTVSGSWLSWKPRGSTRESCGVLLGRLSHNQGKGSVSEHELKQHDSQRENKNSNASSIFDLV